MSVEERIASSRTSGTASPTPGGSPALGADGRPAESERRWAAELQKVEDAMAGGDAATMLRAWHSACLEALGSQRWQPMVEVGDAALRIGRTTGFAGAFAAKARQAYHVALNRAHKEGAPEGVRRVADGFTALGDQAAFDQCASIAERLDGKSSTPAQSKRAP